MKKFLAIFAAVAVAGTAGFAVIHSKNSKTASEAETTAAQQNLVQADYDDSYGEKSEPVSSEDTTAESTVSEPSSDTAESMLKSFSAQIDAVSGTVLIVNPDKNTQEYNSSDKISFGTVGIDIVDSNGKAVKDDDIKNFSQVQVFYSGDIMETYPAQVNAQKIALSSRKYCNVYFSVNDTIVKTLRVAAGESLDSADMPNAGAYCQDGYHFECWLDGDRSVSYLADINDSVTLTAKISKD